MVREPHNNPENPSDQEYIKRQMKAIKEEYKKGNEVKAQRIADDLIQWLGWDDSDGL
jgi:hypothetical protein